MSSRRFEFNGELLSEFSDSEIRNLGISIESAIDALYTLSDMSRELGDIFTANKYEELAFQLRYIIPLTDY